MTHGRTFTPLTEAVSSKRESLPPQSGGSPGSIPPNNFRPVRKSKMDDGRYDENYLDTGCELAPSCLECPFPRCIEELPGGVTRAARHKRNNELIQRAKEGISTAQLAEEFGISRRSVQRLLAPYRKEILSHINKVNGGTKGS